MPYANLTITVPESVWIGELSRARPETRFRVLAATTTDASGVARVELVGPDPEAVCEEMRAYDAVTDLAVFEAEPDRRRIQIETTAAVLLRAIEGSGVPLETPFEVRDGEMTVEATVPQHRLSELGERLDAFGIPFSVERISREVDSEELLTDRQRWLLCEAIDRGYYDTPRRITLTELAEELDIAASTCSEVLHRAEERVVKKHVREARESRYEAAASAD